MKKNRILSFCKSKELTEEEINRISGGSQKNDSHIATCKVTFGQQSNDSSIDYNQD